MPLLSRKSLWILPLLVILAGCATQPVSEYAYDPPGFFSGVWHGLVLPISIVGSLFWDFRIYAFPNSGWFYDLGFVLGAGASFLWTLVILAQP